MLGQAFTRCPRPEDFARFGLMATSRDRDEHISGCTAAHRRLLDHLDAVLTDDVTRSPSALPDWTVGHVVTHLARNADSHVRMIEGACRGEVLAQYAGGRAERTADIEAGAPRGAVEQLADLHAAIAGLEHAWATCTDRGWAGSGLAIAGEMPVTVLPMLRWREVEIHHADLGLPGFTTADWSETYVRWELDMTVRTWSSRRPMGMTALPPAALALDPHERLAWLTGRSRPFGLPDPGPWP